MRTVPLHVAPARHREMLPQLPPWHASKEVQSGAPAHASRRAKRAGEDCGSPAATRFGLPKASMHALTLSWIGSTSAVLQDASMTHARVTISTRVIPDMPGGGAQLPPSPVGKGPAPEPASPFPPPVPASPPGSPLSVLQAAAISRERHKVRRTRIIRLPLFLMR